MLSSNAVQDMKWKKYSGHIKKVYSLHLMLNLYYVTILFNFSPQVMKKAARSGILWYSNHKAPNQAIRVWRKRQWMSDIHWHRMALEFRIKDRNDFIPVGISRGFGGSILRNCSHKFVLPCLQPEVGFQSLFYFTTAWRLITVTASVRHWKRTDI